MEDNLKQISQFITSDLCIYEMQTIDYPNFIQQQFINSYGTLRSIMQNDHATITKILFSYTQKSVETIAQGFIYYLMIEQKQAQKLLRHLMVLKVQVWQSICQNLQILLKDSTYNIKNKYKLSYGDIFQQLIIYKSASIQVSQLLIKTIQTYQHNQHNIEVSKSLLSKFYSLIIQQKDLPQHIMFVFYHFLFLKCLKILSMKCKQLQTICIQIIQLLWKKNQNQCLKAKSQITIILSQFSYFQNGVIKQIKQKLRQTQQNYQIRSRLFSALIPLKIQNSIIQILNQPMQKNHIKIYLNWMHKSQIQNFQYPIKIKLYPDIARLLILQDKNLQVRVQILFWLVKTVLGMGQNQAFFRMRWLIFYDWLVVDNKQPFVVLITTINFLKFVLIYQPKLGEDFLIYLLKIFNQTNKQRLRNVLWQAYSQKIFQLQLITKNMIISKAVKDQIIKIMGNFQQPRQTSIQFNPQKDSQQKQQQINYDQPISLQLSNHQRQKNNQYKLNIDQNFVLQIQDQLSLVLQQPNLQKYKSFLAKVWKVIIKQKQNLQPFLQQTAKITYVLFNHQFQDFQLSINLQQSIIHFLIKYVVDQWKRVTFKLQITKKLIKKLIDIFPIVQVVLWKHFLLYFKLGGANNRDVKNWLFPKEKLKNAISIIQQVTEKVNQTIRSNAIAYRIQVP